MIVLDASAAIPVLINIPGFTQTVRNLLNDSRQTLHVPHLFDLEVVSALRRLAMNKQISDEEAIRGLTALNDLSVVRYAHSPFQQRLWGLRQTLTPYDATYVALAEALDAPLITLDAKLARAHGHSAEIQLVQ